MPAGRPVLTRKAPGLVRCVGSFGAAAVQTSSVESEVWILVMITIS